MLFILVVKWKLISVFVSRQTSLTCLEGRKRLRAGWWRRNVDIGSLTGFCQNIQTQATPLLLYCLARYSVVLLQSRLMTQGDFKCEHNS